MSSIASRARCASLTEEFCDQLNSVIGMIMEESIWTKEHVDAMANEYYNTIGLPRHYFLHTPVDRIAKHIQSLHAAKVLAKNAGHPLDLSLSHEEEDSALFVSRSTIVTLQDGRVARADEQPDDATDGDAAMASVRKTSASEPSPCAKVESYIESTYLSHGAPAHESGDSSALPLAGGIPSTSLSLPGEKKNAGKIFRLQCFRSSGVAAALPSPGNRTPEMGPPLRLYFLEAPRFQNEHPPKGETRLEELADPRFLQQTSALPRLRRLFQQVMEDTVSKLGPSIHAEILDDAELESEFQEEDARPTGAIGAEQASSAGGDKMILMMVGVHAGSTHSLFQGITDVYRWHGLYATRKYCEPFSNGVTIFSFYLKSLHAVGPSRTPTAAPGDDQEGQASPPGDEAAKDDSDSPTTKAAKSTLSLLKAAALRGARTRQSRAQLGLEERIVQLQRDVSLCFALPKTSLTPMLSSGMLSAQEVTYAYVAWKFAYHFLSRGSEEYASLAHTLRDNPTALAMLSRMRRSLRTHAFTEGAILDAIARRPDLVSQLYSDFAARFMPNLPRRFHCRPSDAPATGTAGSGNAAYVDVAAPGVDDPLPTLSAADIRRKCQGEADTQVFLAFLKFNTHVLKTNFYKQHSVALAFRLDPNFLSKQDYPETPFGIFFVVGAEFRGFHIRFRDIARGGIRIVRSANTQAFAHNVESMFDEGYGLSNTQQKKNKDIPEGGSKGVVMLNFGHQDKAQVAFQKYCDAVLDLILVPTPPAGVAPAELPVESGDIVDYYGRQELLFFGPDENTAGFMDWASSWARRRGYAYWKGFTTGKSWTRGGLPHDKFGMTTHSVRAYAEGIQEKLRLSGPSCTKVQTGGPDGDLGSNEIKYGNETTVAIVDGSGVLYDPNGIDKTELLRLAEARKPVKFFNQDLLGPEGFHVGVEERDVHLPNGVLVESGLDFRNTFHLQPFVKADFFIPCGGRPAAVTLENVAEFLYGIGNGDGVDSAGSAVPKRFKYIVEGANLFFTQDARIWLEKAGLVVVKDAAANKGGVTCSSLEVLAALALNDTEFNEHMCVRTRDDGTEDQPAFYRRYAQQIQKEIIPGNAALEFACLWREHQRSGKPLSHLTDELSVKITDLSAKIEDSDALWHNLPLRTRTLHDAIPSTLSEQVGGAEAVLERLPENYRRALFGSRLASRFVYESGLASPEFAFFEYVQRVLPVATGNDR